MPTDLNREGMEAAKAAQRKALEECQGVVCQDDHLAEAVRAYFAHANPDTAALVEAADIEKVDRACKAYAEATGYYVQFHSGLSSPSADKMREGMRAALNAIAALSTVPAKSAEGEPEDREEAARDLVNRIRAQNWKNGGVLAMDIDEAVAAALAFASPSAPAPAEPVVKPLEWLEFGPDALIAHGPYGHYKIEPDAHPDFAVVLRPQGQSFESVELAKARAEADYQKRVRSCLLPGAAAAGVPEGFVLVPVEPTTQMVDHGLDCISDQYLASDWDEAKELAEDLDPAAIYRAMLAARPADGGK